jgi:hypothetical protein
MVRPRRPETSERARCLLSLFFKDLLSRLEARAAIKGSEAFCGLLVALLSRFEAKTGTKGLGLYIQPAPPFSLHFCPWWWKVEVYLSFFFFMCTRGV